MTSVAGVFSLKENNLSQKVQTHKCEYTAAKQRNMSPLQNWNQTVVCFSICDAV